MIDGNDRVRENTASNVNIELDREMADRVREYSGRTFNDITRRLNELDREWDIERVLEMNASLLAFSGLVLSVTHGRKWLVLPSIVLPFLFQHSIQGWCPPVPVLRRLGIRTRKEIDREKFALKYLRGDFENEKRIAPTAALKAVTVQ
jgi:hypothetical protein